MLNEYRYTLDHILINKIKITTIIMEAGVLASEVLPTDHRITVATLLKNHPINNNKVNNKSSKEKG